MSFGNSFCPYSYVKKKYGVLPNQITSIDRNRTYKKFVEFTVFYTEKEQEKTISFKIVLSELTAED